VNTVPIPCAGRCNSAWRAAERRYETTGIDHDLEPRDGQPVWCPPCTTAIRSALADMPALAAALREEIESGVSAAMAEFVSGSKNRPVHDHEAASFLLDEFTEWVGEWEDTVRKELGLNPRRLTINRLIAVAGAAEVLLSHLDWHLGGRCAAGWDHLHTPDWTGADVATDFGLDMLRYHRRAQCLTASQDPEPVRIVGVECPNCGHKALEYEVESESNRMMKGSRYRYGSDGDVLVDRDKSTQRPVKVTEAVTVPARGAVTGYIRCRKCRPTFTMTHKQLDQWMKILAAGREARERATPELLAEIFGGTVPRQYQAMQ
jgi:DNA-directed RNA polymerase subunit RPC12/RpoP